ncbi:MAG: 1-acyl-sn-glycerol-3-phosphate acyltransferase [Leptospiraceae bacterium]|nr:1-acyl-sn-glycerol-3-phosphate acyltransferase [Leptospiraceae bacterium]
MAQFPWENQFMASVPAFVAAGMAEERAHYLLQEYIRLAHSTPMPPVLDFSKGLASDASPYLARDQQIHELMLAIFEPLLSRFALDGKENFHRLLPALKTCGVTLVANHLSHFDAAVIYALLNREADLALYARELFFIAGRLVFTSDFSRVAGRMFNTMLVASPRDIEENPGVQRQLAQLNIRSFKEAKSRQRNGQALVLYPEGTRSRDARMGQFHAALYNYVEGTVVLPVALTGPEKILHAEAFTFGLTSGAMKIGEPLFVGAADDCPAGITRFDNGALPKHTRKQQTMDALGKAVADLLPAAMRGFYAADRVNN